MSIFYQHSMHFLGAASDCVSGGGLGIFTDRGQRSFFFFLGGGVESRMSVFFWVLVTDAVFLGLLNNCCISECFII